MSFEQELASNSHFECINLARIKNEIEIRWLRDLDFGLDSVFSSDIRYPSSDIRYL
jgi:hypothetical protein